MQVHVTTQAQWLLGLIQRKHRGDTERLAEIQLAYYSLIAELRTGHHSIWLVDSHLKEDAFSLNHPPLVAQTERRQGCGVCFRRD
jgi:hypothetical protein